MLETVVCGVTQPGTTGHLTVIALELVKQS